MEQPQMERPQHRAPIKASVHTGNAYRQFFACDAGPPPHGPQVQALSFAHSASGRAVTHTLPRMQAIRTHRPDHG